MDDFWIYLYESDYLSRVDVINKVVATVIIWFDIFMDL